MTELIDMDASGRAGIDDFDSITPRAAPRRTVANSNPLKLSAEEFKIIEEASQKIARNLQLTRLETYDQIFAFNSALLGIEAAVKGDWETLLSAASAGLEASLRANKIEPYVIGKKDDANRNLASDQRNALKELALRLGRAAPATTRSEIDQALCLRAMTYAAIAADRGLMHIVKNNLGAVIKTIGAEDFPARRDVSWKEQHASFAARYRDARVQMP